jgi:predicted transcriptional regulator
VARKLTDDAVRLIYKLVNEGKLTRRQAAETAEVALETVAKIMRGDTHRHLTKEVQSERQAD